MRRCTDSWHPAGSDATSDSASDSAVHEPESSKLPASTGGQRKDPRIGKRKPCPDLNTIEDMQERRKQRRLAKNRATAAVSRCALITSGLAKLLHRDGADTSAAHLPCVPRMRSATWPQASSAPVLQVVTHKMLRAGSVSVHRWRC